MPATAITYQASGLTMNCLFLPVTNKQQPDWVLLTVKKNLLRNPFKAQLTLSCPNERINITHNYAHSTTLFLACSA